MREPALILVVDDVADNVEILQLRLESQGYQVVTAGDGVEALEKIRTLLPDLLLLDIMMGRGAEGVMMARKIRKDPALSDLPILIITGIREQIAFMFPGQAVHPNFVPLNELIEKPVEPDLLLERVAALLKAAASRGQPVA